VGCGAETMMRELYSMKAEQGKTSRAGAVTGVRRQV